jgi:hypothetical protein
MRISNVLILGTKCRTSEVVAGGSYRYRWALNGKINVDALDKGAWGSVVVRALLC